MVSERKGEVALVLANLRVLMEESKTPLSAAPILSLLQIH